MTSEQFITLLRNEVSTYKSFLETDSQDWIVKGFIDIDKNVYTITNDTKVVSKSLKYYSSQSWMHLQKTTGWNWNYPLNRIFILI